MRAIINAVRYDTDKAIKLGNARGGMPGDVRAYDETLYRTPDARRYFIAGWGGAKTRWAERTGDNMWSDGRSILPLSEKEALDWAEKHLSPDAIDVEFSHLIDEA